MTSGFVRRLVARHFGEASVGRYAAIGVSGVALDTGLFALLTHLGLLPIAATVLSTSAGIINNYLLNAKLNFNTPYNAVHFRRFFTVGIIGLGVAAASLQLLLGAGLTSISAKLVSLPVVLVSQFLANKYWTFRVAAPTEREA